MFLDDGSGQSVDWSQKISAKQTQVSGDTRKYAETEVEVAVRSREEPALTAIVQFSGSDEILDRCGYAPGTLPDRIDVNPETEYIIVEESSAEGTVRTLFRKDDAALYAFYSRGDGILAKQQCEIGWPG